MKRIVIKLGTGILTRGIGEVDTARISSICAQVAELRRRGYEPLVVSSGAIGMGMGALGLTSRPRSLAKLQACAAVGQSRLIQCWQDGLQPHGLVAGQILLTHEGLSIRNRYVSAKATIEQLLAYGAVPILNENDSVSTFEIRFGNNDILGAMVASLAGAEHYFILSTIDGFLDMDGDGQVIPVIERITPQIEAMAKGTRSPTAVGGMLSKIQAVKLAVEAGCTTYIANGATKNIILRILDGENVGTRIAGSPAPMGSKKRWLAYFQRAAGSITIDDGAKAAIVQNDCSLLAAGVVACAGRFEAGDVVDVLDAQGQAVARGEIAFSKSEIERIASKPTPELAALYPDRTRLEVIHRDALVLL